MFRTRNVSVATFVELFGFFIGGRKKQKGEGEEGYNFTRADRHKPSHSYFPIILVLRVPRVSFVSLHVYSFVLPVHVVIEQTQ